MERQTPQVDAPTRTYTSWQRKLHSQIVMLLGFLSIAISGMAWLKRKELRQSPLLPSLLSGLMVFLALFGILAFSRFPRAIIVPVHLAGGVAMLILLTWMLLRQMPRIHQIESDSARRWSLLAGLGLLILVIQIMLGSWVSSNFAAIACTSFPLCEGSLLPVMDFSYPPDSTTLTQEMLIAIHMMHRFGAILVWGYLFWLALSIVKLGGMRRIGLSLSVLITLQFGLGIANVFIGMPLVGAVLHNALAMTLLVTLVVLNFKLKGGWT